MLRAVRLLLPVFVALSLPLAPAAARPVFVGAGEGPSVALDASGTAHIVYNQDFVDGAGQPLMYCAWPRAARTCTPRAIVSDGASPSAQPPLIQAGPAPGALAVVSAREPQIVRVDSGDGGATFTAPAAFGLGHYFEGAFSPAGVMLTYRTAFRYRAFAGPATNDSSVVLGQVAQTVVAVAPDGRPVLVSGAAAPGIVSAVWSGQGNIDDPSTWSENPRIARSNDFAVTGGPRGVWLAYADFGRGLGNRVVVRKFSGTRFGAAHRVPLARNGRPFVAAIAIAQAPNGSFLVVWRNGPRDRIEYSVSKTGRRWSTPRLLATGVVQISRLQAVLGSDGRGLAVWDQVGYDRIQANKVDARRALRTTR